MIVSLEDSRQHRETDFVQEVQVAIFRFDSDGAFSAGIEAEVSGRTDPDLAILVFEIGHSFFETEKGG